MNVRPRLDWETLKRCIGGMSDMTWFTHAQIFDDLLVVAQKETACYIWKTTAGLVVLDGIWPDESVYQEILTAIRDAGWEGEKITKFVMTHGHIDHVGCGKWLVERHGVETYLSQADDALRLATPHEEGRLDNWKEFPIDHYLQDGDTIDCGDKCITVVATPGHTDGCMSFLFPVCEGEERHVASLFGGATASWTDPDGKRKQRVAIKTFRAAVENAHSDVALCNHTAFDNGLARIAYSKGRTCYLPNIYILGEAGVQQFCKVYEQVAQ